MEKEAGSEEQQVLRAIGGDRKAFEALVLRYAPLVGSVAYSVVGDIHAAEDVSQEVFHKAYLRLRSLRDSKRFGPWIYGITRTTALDWLRKYRTDRVGHGDPSGFLPQAEERGGGPGQAASDEEESRIVREALFELPEKYREVLVLKHMRDEPYSRIADVLGVSVPAVESLLFRARVAFREVLRKHGIGPMGTRE